MTLTKSILTMTSLAYCTAWFSVSIKLSVALKQIKINTLPLRWTISCMRQINFSKWNKDFSYSILNMLSNASIRVCYIPILYHYLFSIPPENITKPEFFWCFQWVSKETNGTKQVNTTNARKVSKYRNFSGPYRGYRKRLVTWNELQLVPLKCFNTLLRNLEVGTKLSTKTKGIACGDLFWQLR